MKRALVAIPMLLLLGAGCAEPKIPPKGFGTDDIRDAGSKAYGIDERSYAEVCESEGGCDAAKGEIILDADSDWFEGSTMGPSDEVEE